MPSTVGAVAAFGLALGLVLTPQSQAPAPAASPANGATAPGPVQLAGGWEYNADESVNAYTGKPEQGAGNSQRSAANRASGSSGGSGGSRPAGSGSSGSGNPGGATGLGGGSGSGTPGGYGGGPSAYGGPGGGDDFTGAYRGWAAAWSRSAARDLLEIPWALTIDVKPEAVTFTDDLKRSRTYQTDGKKQKYQLGAAVFNAKTYWDGPRLKKEIDTVGSFKMLETYFLSEDANRLFVVLRVGDPKKIESKTVPVTGVNRVYDRVR